MKNKKKKKATELPELLSEKDFNYAVAKINTTDHLNRMQKDLMIRRLEKNQNDVLNHLKEQKTKGQETIFY